MNIKPITEQDVHVEETTGYYVKLNEAINEFSATAPQPWDWDNFENKYDHQ